MATVQGYSKRQIRLHWLAAILIVSQFIFADGISQAWRVVENGGAAVFSPMVGLHVVGGVLVLLIALWRIRLRRTRGVPDAPANDPPLQKMAAHVAHLGLYALMILLPISGGMAWFGGVQAAGEAHQVLKMLLILVVALHVVAALYHQFIVKDRLLLRMMRPLD
jgi:cytochrome b561